MATAKKKTTDKIKASLTELLADKPIDDVTATALCSHAGINRATFYYHYNSVQDVLTEIEDDLEAEFTQWMSQATVASNGAPEKSFYVTFFEFIYRNVSVCKLLLGAQRQSEFLSRAMEAGRTKVVSVMSQLYPNCPASKINYYYIFVSNGFLGLLEYWLNSGMRESINDIADVGVQVSNAGIKYLA
ncbi:MAG: TetR/AcrR family transcriptional regulator [Clostridiales bacterium]|nr:TetR/AcrR family transcriptional regulator [Clostridiales bacterium]